MFVWCICNLLCLEHSKKCQMIFEPKENAIRPMAWRIASTIYCMHAACVEACIHFIGSGRIHFNNEMPLGFSQKQRTKPILRWKYFEYEHFSFAFTVHPLSKTTNEYESKCVRQNYYTISKQNLWLASLICYLACSKWYFTQKCQHLKFSVEYSRLEQ